MIFRLRFVKRGGHVHCRLFQAGAPNHTWQKNGDVVFDWPGWVAFTALTWDRLEILPEDEERADESLSSAGTTQGTTQTGVNVDDNDQL